MVHMYIQIFVFGAYESPAALDPFHLHKNECDVKLAYELDLYIQR
jgi:hypothetical protein